MDNESRFRGIEHDGTHEVLYEILRDEEGERRYRFIVLVRGSEDYQVLVTELTFLLTNGAAHYAKGSKPIFRQGQETFIAREQAEAEARLVFDNYMEQGWLKVMEY